MANTTQVGTTTEGLVLGALVKSGRTVLLPFGSQQDYDCKTGRLKQGSVQFNLYTMAQDGATGKHVRRSYGDRIDFYGVYCPDTDKVYLVPCDAVGAAVGVLRVEPTRNNQTKNIRWAKDYEL